MAHTLIDSLQKLQHVPDKGITFIDGTHDECFLSYKDLYEQALFALYNLQQKRLVPGDRVLFQVEDNRTFVIMFWACLLGKMIPVPVSVGNQSEHKRKLFHIREKLEHCYLLCDFKNWKRIEDYLQKNGQQQDLPIIKETVLLLADMLVNQQPGKLQPVASADIAYIQYSSGSTGDPKGVVLTHANLFFNTTDIAARSAIDANDKMLSWMPLTHDMGLICFHLTAVLSGCDQYILPTPLFIRRPDMWIGKAADHGATILYSPDFGYRYFLSFMAGKSYLWDLSRVRLIYNGAEPISPELVKQFMDALAVYGLPEKSMFPGYGLAEASVAVTLPTPGEGLQVHYLHRAKLGLKDKIESIAHTHAHAAGFVDVGYPIAHCNIRICDDENKQLPDDHIGHIQIKGLNVTAGYYNDPAATEKIFTPDGWLKTGDLGFLSTGRLVITGRLKNIIIINGQNYYPQDIERIALEVPGMQGGVVVAGCTRDKKEQTTRLLLFVLYKKTGKEFIPLMQALREKITEALGLVADLIVPVKKIPKTTSGKIQHFKLLKDYELGHFDEVLQEIDQLLQWDRSFGTTATIADRLKLIYREVCGDQPVGNKDNFLQSGINSIQLMRLTVRINSALWVDLQMSELFNHPTLESLAACISKKQHREWEVITPIAKREWYDLSANQLRFFLFDKYEQVKGVYNIALWYRLKGMVNVDALSNAIATIAQRHDILRTVFREVDGKPCQQVINMDIGLLQTDLSQHMAWGEKLRSLSCQEAGFPFDLENGPLWRFNLVKVNDHIHYLFFTIHHIIADGWSVSVLFKEMEALYNAYCNEVPVTLPQLKVQFKDCWYWQQSQLENRLPEYRAYWKNELAGMQVLQLPVALARTAGKTYEGRLFGFSIDEALCGRLNALSKESGATLYMTLLSLLNIVFYKYTGQTDIILGTDAAGRNLPGLDDQVGCYSNALPVRTRFQAADSWSTLLENVKEKVLQAFDYQQYPFNQLVEDLTIVPESNRSPVFDVLVLFQNFSHTKPVLSKDIEILQLEPPVTTSFVDLQIEFIEDNGRLVTNIRYNSSLFDAAQISRLAGHFIQTATSVVNDPNSTIAQIEILSKGEKQSLLNDFNSFPVTYGEEDSVLARFAKQAATNPDAIAITCGEAVLTYGQLHEESDAVAGYLINQKQIKCGDRVGIYLQQSERMIVALLGILKTGAAYVPLDLIWPAHRIEEMLLSGGIRLVVVDDATPVTGLAADYVTLNEACRGRMSMPQRQIRLSDPAYVMYTSGTTGKPKGVIISHTALLDYVCTFSRYFNITGNDCVLQQASLAFDTSVEEIFPALCSGARIHVQIDGGRNIPSLIRSIQEEGITLLSTTPLVINEVNRELQQAYALRAVISGGDVLRPAHIDRLFELVPVFNTYGPTEATVCALFNRIDRLDRTTLLGKPIDNKYVYIVDDDLNLVAEGVTGEICIAGAGLASGYYGLDEETAKKFIPNPFNSGTRLYRTGDRGKWLPDGSVSFAGRKDTQIKLRGYRIEPGEIEAALSGMDGIEDVLVTMLETSRQENVLVAYVVSKTQLDFSAIRMQLMARLPAYMIPSYFTSLDRFPRLSNEKIDHKQLPLPADMLAAPVNEYKPPRNTTEKILVEIWAQVLEIEDPGITGNFFELGGHSIAATKIILQVARRLQVSVSLSDFFACYTIELLAMLINKRSSHFASIPFAGKKAHYDLSDSQKRIWLLNQLQKEGAFHNLCWSCMLEGNVDHAVLEKTLDAIVQRHASLRTNFVTVNDEPQQVIRGHTGFILPFTDLRNEENGQSLVELLAAEELRPFNLEKDLLIRARLIRFSNDKYALLLSIHHIVTDAWSMEILVEELAIHYNACLNGRLPVLPQQSLQYIDYAEWRWQQLLNDTMNPHQAYWNKKLSGELSPLQLQIDFPEPAAATYAGNKISHSLDEVLCRKILAAGSLSGVTSFTMLLACVKLLLFKYTGNNDVIIGIPVSGRIHADLERLVGCFINILPLRSGVTGNECFKGLIQTVKHTILEAYEHQEYPFDSIVKDINPVRTPGHSPLFDVLVSYRNSEKQAPGGMEGIIVSHTNRAQTSSEYRLSIEFIEMNGAIQVDVEYNTGLFKKERIERLIRHFKKVASWVIDNSSAPFVALNLPDEEERSVLLKIGNANIDATIEFKGSLQQRFEETVSQFPHHIALTEGDCSVMYSELNEKSNRLAHLLIDTYKIKPEDRVGVIMERSVNLITTLLAIIKAGAAYVPIEPDLPSQRIDHMLKDCMPVLIITDRNRLNGMANQPELLFNDLEMMADKYPSTNPIITAAPGNLAYIIFTSGSTGAPKGVMIEYRSLYNYVSQFINYFNLDHRDVVIQQSPVSFDIAVEEIFPVLCSGGRLVVLKPGGKDLEALTAAIETCKATVVSFTPLIAGELNKVNYEQIKSLRLVICGGDKLMPSQVDNLLGKMKVYNTYGPTETTVCASYHRITAPDDVPLIGKPLLNRRIYIVDAADNLQPVGIPGEICIGGDGLARGYLNHPELTSMRFIGNPFGEGRIFKTGDLGYWNFDENLVFVGRNDGQVKIRGYRVETGEIENRLLAMEGVASCVVIVKASTQKQLLVAYVVVTNNKGAEDIRHYLRQFFPEYMVPAQIILLEKVPVNANGKIDRKALPDPEDHSRSLNEQGPDTILQVTLLNIWQQVLSKNDLGIYDNFFELGGHSLIAMQILSAIARELEVQVALQDLFLHPTIAALADCISAASYRAFVPIEKIADQEHYALSPAQRRFWLICQLAENRNLYNMPAGFRFKGAFNTKAFIKSFETLIARHEILRTTFVSIHGEPRQLVHDATVFPFSIDIVDLTYEPEKQENLDALISEEIETPIDLQTGPLFRGVLYRISSHEYVLVFNMHHIISDGLSIEILIDDLVTVYNSYCEETVAALPPLSIQYKDYTYWQNSRKNEAPSEANRKYWKEQLQGRIPVLSLATDYPRSAENRHRGNTLRFVINAQLTTEIKKQARQQHATLFMTLLSLVNLLLHKYSGQEDLIIGVPVDGREHKDLENLAGLFINSIAIRTQIQGADTFTDLLEKVKWNLAEGYKHQGYSFDDLVEELHIIPPKGRSPVYDVMCVFETMHNSRKTMSDFNGLVVTDLQLNNKVSKRDLTFLFINTGKEIEVMVTYNTDLFKELSVLLYFEKFLRITEQVIADPLCAIADIDMQTKEEKTLDTPVFDISFKIDL